MGCLILCKNSKVSQPYYADELGIYLYSPEELCYFIYNNVMLIDDTFFDDKLYSFLNISGFGQLTDKIKKWKDEVDFKELLLVILQDIKYYNEKELEFFKKEIERIASEGYENILKEKADYLFSIERYYEAIKLYTKILSSKNLIEDSLKADVYAARAVSHTRLFSYNDATVDYLSAYELSSDLKYIKNIYLINKITSVKAYPTSLIETIDPTILASWDGEYAKNLSMAAQDDVVLEIESLKEKDALKIRSGLLKLISKWKTEYKKCQN